MKKQHVKELTAAIRRSGGTLCFQSGRPILPPKSRLYYGRGLETPKKKV
ncbi:hypothetical protein [Dinghuibacter silviterrae]|nr:hypothetical protein [Dinghuibacter silviterrae]